MSHFASRMGWNLFFLLCVHARMALGGKGVVKKSQIFPHQSSSDISNNSNLESITKTNKDIAGESAGETSDTGTGYVN